VPGDQITSLNGRVFAGFKDFLYSAVIQDKQRSIQGYKINYYMKEKESFTIPLKSKKALSSNQIILLPKDIAFPASYLLVTPFPDRKDSFIEGAPLAQSGIQNQDRIIWADGEIIFSAAHLKHVINQPKTLLTIKRGDTTLLKRIPRVRIRDIKNSPIEKNELDDWQHAAHMAGNIEQCYFIPFAISYGLVIENDIPFINEEIEEIVPNRSALLQKGDQIIAVDGIPVTTAVEFFSSIQKKRVQIIVQRNKKTQTISWQKVDETFFQSVNWKDLQTLQNQIGSQKTIQQIGDLFLLLPIVPITYNELALSSSKRKKLEDLFSKEREQLEKLEDREQKEEALQFHEQTIGRLVLGSNLQDQFVQYNPSPLILFEGVIQEIWLVISNLFRGNLSPKYLSGPVGIFQLMQQSWFGGGKEAIYFLGVISLNLGLLNLLPIPVLDGGHICFSIYEMISKKRIRAKTMERLIIPFVVLLVVFFIYVTYQDILRLIKRFF